MQINIISVDYSNQQHSNDLIFLMSEYAKDPMGGGQDLTDEVKDNLVENLIKIPGAYSVLAYVDDNPAGLINCFEGFSTFNCRPLINIHDVIVTSQYRSYGICQKMLERVQQIANQRDCCKLTLEVLNKNQIAKQSYEKFGFSAYELSPDTGKALFWEKKL